MLRKVVLKKKRMEDYLPFVGKEKINRIKGIAQPLKRLRVLHINTTASGGGVAELLNSSIPLLNSLDLEVDWALLCKEEPFFEVTKNIHNALQGKKYLLSPESKSTYLNRNRTCAGMLDEDYDIIMIHDPQPAALRHFYGRGKALWIWRCHIDTSTPDQEVWMFLRPFIEKYDAVVFTMREFAPPDLLVNKLRLISPAIDPLTSKNIDLPVDVCRTIVSEFGVDLNRPILLQVSRFDPWKDPLGVVEVYWLAKREIPNLQLVFIGTMAEDDPEGWVIYQEVKNKVEKNPDIFLYTNLSGVNAFEVNCFQRIADVVIQKSIREGFGLVVSEALWKAAAVVAGRAGGIPLQIKDGLTGFLTDSTDDCAQKVIYLLQNEEERKKMGKSGREYVREHFLIPTYVEKEIELYLELLEKNK
jgi:trehalose synthase